MLRNRPNVRDEDGTEIAYDLKDFRIAYNLSKKKIRIRNPSLTFIITFSPTYIDYIRNTQKNEIVKSRIKISVPSVTCIRSAGEFEVVMAQYSECLLLTEAKAPTNEVAAAFDVLAEHEAVSTYPLIDIQSFRELRKIVLFEDIGNEARKAMLYFLANGSVNYLKHLTRIRPRTKRKDPERYERLFAAFERHVTENINSASNMADIADALGVSTGTLNQAIKRMAGMTPHAYLVEKRLGIAKMLLGDGELALAAISAECGFASQSHLSTVFKERVGLTPREYRRRMMPNDITPCGD